MHPELRRYLESWSAAFESSCGVPPRPTLPIAPRMTRGEGLEHHTRGSLNRFAKEDFAAAGVVLDQKQDIHSLRRYFVSACRAGGADPVILERITHNATGSMLDRYTFFERRALERCVLAMEVRENTPDPRHQVANLVATRAKSAVFQGEMDLAPQEELKLEHLNGKPPIEVM